MAFISKADLGQNIYEEILNGITRANDAKITTACSEAQEEVTGYICAQYDTDDLFSKEGDARNKTILSLCRIIAIYRLHSACNTMPEIRRLEYEDAVKTLGKIQSGKILLQGAKLQGETDEVKPDLVVEMKSNPKRNNQF
ncbi:phage protein Gp36 family protein [uncultured Draconibacterium sp.]|uniref:phage protein Gp36 family protein n=1 Tax=uncultured Draconibacterium sp. TaxID=1573823 RepID=UPI0025F0E44F|nr:phage protein Gp36 family protein [uncultured Draconibacterium sp.]